MSAGSGRSCDPPTSDKGVSSRVSPVGSPFEERRRRWAQMEAWACKEEAWHLNPCALICGFKPEDRNVLICVDIREEYGEELFYISFKT